MNERLTPESWHTVVAELVRGCATSLARRGEFGKAADLLNPLVYGPTQDLLSLDLYARMEAQQGRFEEARQLWQVILQRDPPNKAAKDAIARIENPRRGLPLVVMLSSAACVFVLIGFIGMRWIPRPVNTQQPLARPALPAVWNQMLQPEEFQVSGANSELRDGVVRVTFPQGLFVRSTVFRTGAQSIINEFAKVIARSGKDVRVTLVGVADGVPLLASSRYPDNEALAMMRAATVYAELRHQLQHHVSLQVSAGSPGDPANHGPDPTQRTVIFLISPNTTGLSNAAN